MDIELFCGDCLVEMNKIQSNSVDMVLCDLPYGVLNKSNILAQWDKQLPLQRLWEHYKRIVKPNGAIVLFGQGMFTAKLMMSNPKMWRYNLVWDKVLPTGFLNANKMPLRSHEDILVFYEKLPTYNPQMAEGEPLHGKGQQYKTKKPKNRNYGVFEITDDSRKGSVEKFPKSIVRFAKPHPSIAVHSTEKPVSLCEWLIKTYTNEKETVLDNCMGSGSVGVAAVNAGRNFIGIELNKEYFQIAQERIKKAEERNGKDSLC